MQEPKVDVEYIVRRKDTAVTWSICYTPTDAIQKLQEAEAKTKKPHKIIRKTTTYQELELR